MPMPRTNAVQVPKTARTAPALCSILLASAAFAPALAQITLTFERLQDNEQILNYYNGGLGSLGVAPGRTTVWCSGPAP